MIQHRRELDEYIQAPGELSLQTDFAPMSDTTPHEAWAWLLKSGVSSSLCRAYGIGWSDALARVVLPVWSNRDGGDKRLAVVQSRAVLPGQKPKYLNKTGVNSQSVLFWSLEDTLLEEPVLKDTVILHEDMLSTIRVGRLIPAVASLGTSLSAVAAAEILSKYSTVIIWYDGDEAGRRGARKARRTLKLQGAEVRVIRTDEDPKEYNNDEIKKIVARA